MTNVVIVESPAKAKTINKYLGSQYKVLASYGHVRNLPKKNGSIDVDNDFNPKWEIDTKSKKHLDEIVKALKSSSKLILATDPAAPAPIDIQSNIMRDRNKLSWVGAIIIPTAAVNTASHITLGFKRAYKSLNEPVAVASELSKVFNKTTYLIRVQ